MTGAENIAVEAAKADSSDPLHCAVCGIRVYRLGVAPAAILVDDDTTTCPTHARGYVAVKAQARLAAERPRPT